MKKKIFYLTIFSLIGSFFACHEPKIDQLTSYYNMDSNNEDHPIEKLRNYM